MSTTLMTPAVPRPRLPSSAEIEKALRERLPGLTIYNPSDRWVNLEVFGLMYAACPDLGGAIEANPYTREPVVCDGKTTLRGRYLTQKDSSGKVIEGQDAAALVKYIIGPETYGQMGFVWLPGTSAEEDANLVAAAKDVWVSFQQKQDEDIVAKRMEFKANWQKNPQHKGMPCPPPTAYESAAVQRMATRQRRLEFKFECPVESCPGYAVNDWNQFSDHMRLAHNQIGLDRARFDGGLAGSGGGTTLVADIEPESIAAYSTPRSIVQKQQLDAIVDAAGREAIEAKAAPEAEVAEAPSTPADQPTRRSGKR